MRAVRYHEHGDEDVLEVEAIPRPEPGHGEVGVRVEAASVNPVDTYFREGSYEPADLPMVTGSDVAGVVDAVGPGVDEFAVGDRVFATGLGKTHQGTCAEYVVAPVDRTAHLPESVTFEVGAAVALVGATTWQSLVATCGIRPGDVCLIHGGSGGVGHVAVQLAAAAGASVTATASPGYHHNVHELGADTVFDYARADLAAAVEEASSPDVILDHRADQYLQFDADVAAFDADVAVIGNTEPSATFENVPAARANALSVHHVSVFNTPAFAAVLDRIARLLTAGDLDVEIARRYDLEEVPEAHRAVLADSYLGKLVVSP